MCLCLCRGCAAQLNLRDDVDEVCETGNRLGCTTCQYCGRRRYVRVYIVKTKKTGENEV